MFNPKALLASIGILTSITFALASPNCTEKDPRVRLDYATYEGKALDNGVDQFVGMRYAAPPTGDLRWRAPALPEQQGFQLAQDVRAAAHTIINRAT